MQSSDKDRQNAPQGNKGRVELGPSPNLAKIPVVDVGPDFPLQTLRLFEDRAHNLMDQATRHVPKSALKQLDKISRAWLQRWENDHLPEIDAVAEALDRPGAYFFSVNYEWGCSCRVAPSPCGTTARLVRVLDWRTPGLGRNIIAARVSSPAGPFTTLTWPGYTGVLTALAPGRFCAALNQAPMRKSSGFFVLDWAANRRRVWHTGHMTPAHLLRSVFESAETFEDAKRRLSETPISTPAIFLLAGLRADDALVIERTERAANVVNGAPVAANHWQTAHWAGRPRGRDSAGRAALMHTVSTEFDAAFPWLTEPILNERTRLVMIGDAAKDALLAQGFEGAKPATEALTLGKI